MNILQSCRRLVLLPLLCLLAACAGPQVGEQEVRYGRVTRIEAVQIDSNEQLGLGAIIGAVAGGVIGNQFGQGSGNAVSTVAGVLAGGVAGQKIQQHVQKQPGQHIIVKLNNGVTVGITQPADAALHVGDAVRIDGSGNDARVIRLGS
ncbi:MAG: glycine zipper 2TM domain-containing protein [Rhodocyclaceae bacterium]